VARRLNELLLPALVLGILLLFTYARFYSIAYIGFHYNGTTGEVRGIYEAGQPLLMKPGDLILEVNGTPWNELPVSRHLNPLANARAGDLLVLTVDGADGQRLLTWPVPGFNYPEFANRLINTWVLSYIFWIAGTAALVLVRPRDMRWALLVALNYVTAIWFLAGTISGSSLLESPFVLRAGVWMSLPIYLHFHYNFPRLMGKPRTRLWAGFYALAGILAIAQWFQWLPDSAYYVALLGAVLGSLGLLTYRFVTRAQEHREIGPLFFAVAVALLPTLVVAVASRQVNSSLSLSGLLLSLIALPGAYFYVVYRRQLGGLEFRANRLISAYLFMVLLTILGLIFIPLMAIFIPGLNEGGAAILLAALTASVIGIFGFPAFQSFVERRLLGIAQPPQHVLENFAGRISTSFSQSHLVGIVTEEVLPSLLVRQSALLDFETGAAAGKVVYLQGVSRADLPAAPELRTLRVNELWVRPVDGASSQGIGADWVRAALPLAVGGEARGLWLLGRKDPDDYYSQGELNLLRSLADQMAIALANISQAKSLRALHQADIERQEVERVHLARELHDDVLQRISELGHQVDDALYAKGFGKQLDGLAGQVRNLINGLRPPLMDQGLYFALRNLADELAQKPFATAMIKFDVPRSDGRFDPMVEQHLYRIMQQACENALQHAEAKHISIHGHLAKDGADLVVEDDGKGFTLNRQTDLEGLLSTRHFGLAGMQERAAMIDAQLLVNTAPGKGTRVQLSWQEGGQKATDNR